MRKQRKPASSSDPGLATGSNAPVGVPVTLEQAIGREIRHRRARIGLTGADLASAAGVSPGMMSKIETGGISPSLTSLQSIARALNTPLATLFAASEERRDCSFVKRGQGVLIERRGTKVGHQYQLLGHSISGNVAVEPYLITLTSEAAPYTAFRHEGMELIFMLSGKVSYQHGDDRYLLEPGDALFFDATATHGPDDLIELPMTYLSIIVYQRR